MFNKKLTYCKGFQWFKKLNDKIEDKINPHIFSKYSRNRKTCLLV